MNHSPNILLFIHPISVHVPMASGTQRSISRATMRALENTSMGRTQLPVAARSTTDGGDGSSLFSTCKGSNIFFPFRS